MNLANKVATIVPKAHLAETKDDRYFMGLVHAAFVDKVYFDFFKDRAAEGKYVILDNSAVELGHPFNPHQYIHVANAMKASEVCLPDLFQDAEGTLKAAKEFLDLLDEDSDTFNLMAIPQGKTIKEWLNCVDRMLELPINTIGISCRYTKMFGNRIIAVGAVMPKLAGTQIKIHLLGNYLNPQDEIAPLLVAPFIRGVDSSTPCVYTRENMAISDGQPSPEHHHINFLEDKYDEPLLRKNIHCWRSLCQWLPYSS